MASYGNTVLTSAGIDLVKRVIAKTATFEITKVATSSDSRLTNATISAIEAMTSLPSVNQNGKVTAFDTSNSKQVGLKCEFTNQGLTNPYNICGVGIYAKEAGKNEILFAVAPAKEPETMPAKPNDQSALFSFSLNMYVVVGQASAMSITATTEGVIKSINGTIKPDANGNVTVSYYSQAEVDQKISSLSSRIDSLNSSKTNNTDFNALKNRVSAAESGKADKTSVYDKSSADARYLQRDASTMLNSGAVIKWADSGHANNGNNVPYTAGGLKWTGKTDSAEIRAEETGVDNLDLVFDLGDDSSNAVDFRWNNVSKAKVNSAGKFTGHVDWANVDNKDTYSKAEIDSKVNSAKSEASSTYLPKSGGIMTGNIGFQTKGTRYDDAISVHANDNDPSGIGIGIGAGGSTVIGGGESKTHIENDPSYDAADERLVLANDADIEFITNAQNGLANATKVRIDAKGKFTGHVDWANVDGKDTYSRFEIDSKINTAKSEASARSDQAQNNVNALSSKVTNMQHDVASVKATVSNIKVGGRNLLRNSDKLPYSGITGRSWLTGQWCAAGITTDTEDMKRKNKEIADPPQGDKATVISFTGILRPSVSDISLVAIRGVPVSGNVTVSFWARQTSGVDTAFVSASWGVQKAADVVNTNASTEIWGTTSYPYRKLFLPKDGSWTRFWATFNVNDKDSAYIGAGNTGTSAEVQICLVKIETGTMATDWTPAPEDLEERIQTNSNAITSVSNVAQANTTAIETKANASDLNALKGNVYDKSTSDGRFVNASGDTMSGNLVLDSSHHLEHLGGVVNFSKSFEGQSSINSLINALRPLTGCSGSFNLAAQDGVLNTGWYNFIWMPYREGGITGGDNGDFGTMLLVPFGGGSAWIVNYNNGNTSIRALAWDENLASTTATANAAKAKAEANATAISTQGQKISQNSIKITDAANAISSLDSKMTRLMPQAAYVPVQVGDKTDLNNMKTCGFYLLQGGTSNSPVDGWTYVTVQGISTRLTQFVWKDLDPYLQWCRWYDGSTWTAWTQYTKAF